MINKNLVVEYKCRHCEYHRPISVDIITGKFFGECLLTHRIINPTDSICENFKNNNIFSEKNKND